MKRYIFLLLTILFFGNSSYSQKMQVESFKKAENDLSAQAQSRKDLNDKNCALIKVGIGLQNVQFEGNVVGNVANNIGEYWVYMPQGSRMLKVKHSNYPPIMVTFADYGIEKLESNRTYQLTMNVSNIPFQKQEQTLTIKYIPTYATVLVDNKMVKGHNGVAKITLPIGQHSFIVACDGYESEEGMVKLKDSAPSNLQVTLSRENVTSKKEVQITFPSHPFTPSNSFSNNIVIPIKDGVNIEMVKVEAGPFLMGGTVEMGEAESDETPIHSVSFTHNFYIGKYEVTQALWQAVMGGINPSRFKGDNLPVETVSWNDCQEFINKLNSMTNRKFRLPTEAEWEYAARGGIKSKGCRFSGSNNLVDIAWCYINAEEHTHPVGTKMPNELGIYDMSGNVYEWCQDWYGEYRDYAAQVDPIGALEGEFRVTRGGCFWGIDKHYRASYRAKERPTSRNYLLGLRLALSE